MSDLQIAYRLTDEKSAREFGEDGISIAIMPIGKK